MPRGSRKWRRVKPGGTSHDCPCMTARDLAAPIMTKPSAARQAGGGVGQARAAACGPCDSRWHGAPAIGRRGDQPSGTACPDNHKPDGSRQPTWLANPLSQSDSPQCSLACPCGPRPTRKGRAEPKASPPMGNAPFCNRRGIVKPGHGSCFARSALPHGGRRSLAAGFSNSLR